MITIKYIEKDRFIKMYEQYKLNLRVCFSDIEVTPYDTKEERQRKFREALNPPLPKYIDYHDVDGIIRYMSIEE